MELKRAQEIAVAICHELQPFTSRLHIAGSIRRKKPEVKDIEIVCLPIKIASDHKDLFGETTVNKIISPDFIKTVKELGEIEKGSPEGRYCKIILSSNIALDLFIPEEDDFIRQYVIRTGSADYAHKVIASAWKRLGWVGTNIGLRRIEDCIEHKVPGTSKSTWECVRNKNNKPPVWPDEISFFNWLNLNYVEPKFRNI